MNHSLISLIFAFPLTVLAQQDLNLLNINNDPSLYSGEEFTAYSSKLLWNSGDQFKTLKNPVRVMLPARTTGYSHPSFVNEGSGFTLNRAKYQCNYSSELSGDLVYVSNGVGAVRLDPHRGCQSGKLNSPEDQKDVVFFRLDQIKSTGEWGAKDEGAWEDSDALTEASFKGLTIDVGRKSPTGDLDDLVKKMMAEQEANDRSPIGPAPKGREELKDFMMMNCTEHQPDYHLVYSSLIDLTGNTLNLAFYDKTKKTEAVDETRSQFVMIKDGPNIDPPHLIRPSPAAINCISRQESRWNRYATSPTGAVGIGQQTNINVKDLRCFVYGCDNQKPQAWARKIWDEYHDQAEQQFPRAKYPELYYFEKNGKRVECNRDLSSKTQVGFCPISSIGAIGLYQVIVERDIRMVSKIFSDENRSLTEAERLELLEVLATSHNAGRTVARLVAEGKKIGSWGEIMSTLRQADRGDGGKEVRHYHQVMSRCLKSGQMGDFNSADGVDDCRRTLESKGFKSHLGLNDRIRSAEESQALPVRNAPTPTQRPADAHR